MDNLTFFFVKLGYLFSNKIQTLNFFVSFGLKSQISLNSQKYAQKKVTNSFNIYTLSSGYKKLKSLFLRPVSLYLSGSYRSIVVASLQSKTTHSSTSLNHPSLPHSAITTFPSVYPCLNIA